MTADCDREGRPPVGTAAPASIPGPFRVPGGLRRAHAMAAMQPLDRHPDQGTARLLADIHAIRAAEGGRCQDTLVTICRSYASDGRWLDRELGVQSYEADGTMTRRRDAVPASIADALRDTSDDSALLIAPGLAGLFDHTGVGLANAYWLVPGSPGGACGRYEPDAALASVMRAIAGALATDESAAVAVHDERALSAHERATLARFDLAAGGALSRLRNLHVAINHVGEHELRLCRWRGMALLFAPGTYDWDAPDLAAATWLTP